MEIFKLNKQLLEELQLLDIDIEDITLYDILTYSKTLVNIDNIIRGLIKKDNINKETISTNANILKESNNILLQLLHQIDIDNSSNSLNIQSIILKNINLIFTSPLLNKVKRDNKLSKELCDENKYIKELAILYNYDKDKIANYLISSHNAFTKFIAYEIEGNYINTPFDNIFSDVIDKVFQGKIKRLIINIPMGYGKTFRGTIVTSLRAYAIESRSKILHISYDNTLVQLNSSTIRDIILNSPLYRELFNIKIIDDTNSKGIWKTNQNGVFKASASGAGITGFRAGNINISGFSGIIIIDDPLKPDDALSNTKREFINNRYETTFKSRLASEDTPIIVIMQRLHEKDFTNHLISNYANEWDLLLIPALIEDVEYIKGTKNTYTIDNNFNTIKLDSDNRLISSNNFYNKHISSWEIKYPVNYLLKEKANNPKYFFSQLQQQPIKDTSNSILSGDWLVEIKSRDIAKGFIKIKQVFMFCDTANKTKTYNDYTVFTVLGLTEDNKLLIIDVFRDKVEFYNLILNFKMFWNKWYYQQSNFTNYPKISIAYIEDKASGTSLIQMLRREGYNIIDIQRNRDKVYRVSNIAHIIKQGYLLYHEDDKYDFIPSIKKEFNEFTLNDTHEHDDIIDTIVDGISYIIAPILENEKLKEFNSNVKKLPF